ISLEKRTLSQVTRKRTEIPKPRKRTFKTDRAAKDALAAAVAEKLADGFRDPAALPNPPANAKTRELVLESAIRVDRDDQAAYAVYGDWLEAHGNPLGGVIAHALAGKAPTPKQLGKLGMPGEKLATATWRWGMWDVLRLENDADWMDDTFDALALVRGAFAMVPCAALRELRIGVLRWEHNWEDVPAVLAEAAKHAWAHDLQSLVLGDVSRDIDMAHHVIGVVGKAITAAFPKLRSLVLHSSEQTWRGKEAKTFGFAQLALPELESLTIETCSLSKQRVKELLAAKLPKLTKLELWFGMKEYGANATLADIAPILNATAFPQLTSLGLCNTEHACDLADALPHGKLAPQLVRVDLSKGTLDDDAAETLAANAAAFAKLEQLDVSQSFLSPDAIARLGRAFGKRVAINADQQRLDPDDDDEGRADEARYVAIYE
ncbi:MAG TPA: hypothetical protein VGG74_19615, partial [Kofleriaceae bacterium]